jgi:hypothetical protein
MLVGAAMTHSACCNAMHKTLTGEELFEYISVPTKGMGNKVPSILRVCDHVFEWDSKAGVYQQIQPHVIHIPWRPINGM